MESKSTVAQSEERGGGGGWKNESSDVGEMAKWRSVVSEREAEKEG